MAIEFNCEQCGSELQIRQEDAGKRIRCPRCGMISEAIPNRPGERHPDRESGFGGHSSGEGGHSSGEAPTTWQPSAKFQIDDESDRWSLQTPDGDVFGPISRDELDSWEREGRVSSSCLVQRSGQSHWQSALVLYPHLSSAYPAAPASQYRARDPRAHVGTRRRVAPGPSAPRRNNGPAVLAMGILGIVLIGIPVFAMIAWAMGSSEIRAMRRREAGTDGRVLVDIGYYLGIVGTVVGLAIFLGCCLLFTGP